MWLCCPGIRVPAGRRPSTHSSAFLARSASRRRALRPVGRDRDRLPLRHRRAIQCHAYRRRSRTCVRRPETPTPDRLLCIRVRRRPPECPAPGCRSGTTGRPSARTPARRHARTRCVRASRAQWSASWAASPRSRSLSRDHHPYIGRVESVAGIVDLRAVRSAEGGFRDPAPWSHTNRGLGFGPQQARRVNVGRRAGGPHGGGTFLRPGVVARLSGGYVYLWGATPVRS